MTLALPALLAASAVAGDGVWTSGGPDGGEVIALAVDPATAGTVFAGSRLNGAFRSADGGASWSPASAGLEPRLGDLAVAADGTLWAIAASGLPGVFRSVDSGVSWVEVSSQAAEALAIDPSAPLVVYVGGVGVVSKTADGGATWTSSGTGLAGINVLALAVAPGGAGTVYAGTAAEGVYKSVDGGANWSPANTGADDVRVECLAVDPLAPAKVYAGTLFGGVIMSQNAGATWSEANDGLADAPIRALEIDPSAPATVLAGVGSRLFASANGAVSWAELTLGIAGVPVAALAVDPSSSLTVYAGTGAGVAKSVDGGNSWAETNVGLRAVHVHRIVGDPSAPQVLYAASPVSGIFKSLDGGASWQGANAGLADRAITDLAISASSPATLYAGARRQLYKSTDGGLSWVPGAADPTDFGPRGPAVTAVGIDPSDAAIAFAGEWGVPFAGLFGTVDGGTVWTQIYTPPSSLTVFEPVRFAIRASDPDRILAAALTSTGFFGYPLDYLVLRSLDGGVTWQEVLAGGGRSAVDLALDPLDPLRAYAGAWEGAAFELFRSTDGGAAWTSLAPAVPCLRSLEADLLTPATVYLGCDEVFVSPDAGDTWSPFDDNGFPAGAGGARELTLVPSAPATLHAGTFGGVYSYSLPARVDLALGKDDGVTELSPGDPLTYSLEVRNLGPDDAVGARVVDALPAELSCQWTCAGSGACTPGPVAGDIDDLADLVAGALVTYTVACTLSGTASGLLVNQASVTAPAGAVELVAGNNSDADVDVVLTPGACGAFEHRALSDMAVSTAETFEACRTISLGPAFAITATGALVLRAGEAIILGDGVSIETGAGLRAVLEVPAP